MNDDAETNSLPDELAAGWQDLSEQERRELTHTWVLAGQAQDSDPTPRAIEQAERRLINAIAGPGRRADRPVLVSRRRLWTRVAAAALIVVAAGVVFYLAGRPSDEAQTPATAREFMLLLHGEPLVRYPAEDHERIIGEYVDWARALGENGLFIAGNELAPGGRILAVQNGAIREREIENVEAALSGYFIVAAADLGEAARIAADCPHLKYEGTVEVRQIGTN